MFQILKSFKFTDGMRNSKQVLYKYNLFRKHSDVELRCSRYGSIQNANSESVILIFLS